MDWSVNAKCGLYLGATRCQGCPNFLSGASPPQPIEHVPHIEWILINIAMYFYLVMQMTNAPECLIPLTWTGKMKNSPRRLILLLLVFFLSVYQVSAYIDTSTASMVWQLMLAVVLASMYTVHVCWTRIKNVILNKFDKSR
jgi:hypothetical protein